MGISKGVIKIQKKFIDEIIEHSRAESPNEACGILAGKERVEKVYRMTNTDASPESYFMDSREQLRVQKEIRAAGQAMLAIYHSHITAPARPSARDIELAFYPDVSYVIVSIADKNNPSVRSFRITDGKVCEEEVVVEQ